MKKLISMILVLTFVLCTGLTALADASTIEGYSHQVGTWETIEGGVKATPTNAAQHLMLKKTIKEGTVEFKMSGDALGHDSNPGLYFKGTNIDKVTETGHWGTGSIESGKMEGGIAGLGYYMIYFANDEVNLCNMYNGGWNGRHAFKNITTLLNDNGAWKTAGIDVKVEFNEAGAVKIYINNVLAIDYAPAEGEAYPTGGQIALRAVNSKNNPDNADADEVKTINYTNVKVTAPATSSPETGDNTVVVASIVVLTALCAGAVITYSKKRVVA